MYKRKGRFNRDWWADRMLMFSVIGVVVAELGFSFAAVVV